MRSLTLLYLLTVGCSYSQSGNCNGVPVDTRCEARNYLWCLAEGHAVGDYDASAAKEGTFCTKNSGYQYISFDGGVPNGCPAPGQLPGYDWIISDAGVQDGGQCCYLTEGLPCA